MDDKMIEEKVANINKGAYWCGIIGRLSVIYGALQFFPGLLMIIKSGLGNPNPMGIQMLASSIPTLCYGWLFLLARDSFESIVFVLEETRDTV